MVRFRIGWLMVFLLYSLLFVSPLGSMGRLDRDVASPSQAPWRWTKTPVSELPAWKVNGFLSAWKDPDPEVLKMAIQHPTARQAASRLGEAAKEHAPQLLELLKGPDRKLRWAAARALGAIGEAANEQVPQIAALFENPDKDVRRAAASALGRMGEVAKEQAPALVTLLKDSDKNVRRTAAWALGKMGEGASDYASHLVDLLKDPYGGREASVAAQALAAMGERTVAALASQLLAMLEDPRGTYPSVAWMFGHMGGAAPAIAPAVARLLDHSDEDVREAAAQTLGYMGEAAKDYAPQLVKLLKDPDKDLREAAGVTLWAMRTPEFGALLKKPRVRIHRVAPKVLRKISEGEASKKVAGEFVRLLGDRDSDVRKAATKALDANPGAVKAVVDELVKLRRTRYRREVGARALEAIPEALKKGKVAPRLVELFKDSHEDVREAAVRALGKLGDAAKEQAPKVVAFLKERDSDLRLAASVALGFMGEVAKDQVPKIAMLLKNRDKEVQVSALIALGFMGGTAKEQAPKIAVLLKDPDKNVREAAAGALGLMDEAAKNYEPQLAALLKDPDEDVREAATLALGMVRVPAVAALLKDPDKYIQRSGRGEAEELAEVVLGALMLIGKGEPGKEQALALAELSKSAYGGARLVAALALGVMGKAGKSQVSAAAGLLSDRFEDVRQAAANALDAMGPLDLEGILQIVNEMYLHASQTVVLRFYAHFLGGGQPDAETVIVWLGRPARQRVDTLTYNRAVATLEVFKRAWPLTQRLPEVRKNLQGQIAAIVQAITWRVGDLPLLKGHASNLAGTPQQAALLNVIASIERTRWTVNTGKIWLGHAVFWVIMIFVYPKSPQIQAIFFWNPWVRRLVGLGYVGFALTWIPYLRSKLFAPFREPLLADAALESFDPQAYFQESEVTGIPPGVARPITETIPAIRGQLVLEGESGLGKTMFLRHLVKSSQRIVVYLPAKKCAHGVVEAIQEKLHGPARDPAFLRTLIYIGAIDVCIDGLNEVDADTRARISDFAESNFRGNILMATQPLGWTPPSTAKVYILQPLAREQIERFLLTRTQSLPADASVTGKDYEGACLQYLECTLNPEQPDETLATVKRVLSNPMDLTVVAEMLARGQQPDLFHLQQQQYHIMAADYKRTNIDQDFPLGLFSERVYQMRLVGQVALPAEEFLKELQAMERHKMVLSRQYEDPHGSPRKEWYFRHDKVMDFFLVQTFLGADNQRPQKHLGDPRFRGVYFLLAMLLPLEAAQTLREHLIHYAADTKDHTVSHAFIQLLRTRKAA